VGFGKGFAENLVLQRLAPEDALKLEHAIFQLLHLGIADYWLIGIHSHIRRTSLIIRSTCRNSLDISLSPTAITLANTDFGPLRLTNVAAIGDPSDDPIYKTP
jgi:hypothetical protein